MIKYEIKFLHHCYNGYKWEVLKIRQVAFGNALFTPELFYFLHKKEAKDFILIDKLAT
jgi:hypothetical protein